MIGKTDLEAVRVAWLLEQFTAFPYPFRTWRVTLVTQGCVIYEERLLSGQLLLNGQSVYC